jgi:hypothetical protein
MPYSLAFNGNNQYGITTNVAPYEISTLTIEAWVKPSASSQSPTIWSFNNIGHYGLVSTIAGSTYYPVFEYNTYAGAAVYVTSAQAYTLGVWHHVAATVSTTGSGATATVVVNLYLDGLLVATSTLATGWSTTYASSVLIANFNGSSHALNGKIAQLTFYSVALTQAQVRQRYSNAPAALVAPGAVVSQWNFADGQGSTLTDSMGVSNFTLTNAPTWTTDTPSKARIPR